MSRYPPFTPFNSWMHTTWQQNIQGLRININKLFNKRNKIHCCYSSLRWSYFLFFSSPPPSTFIVSSPKTITLWSVFEQSQIAGQVTAEIGYERKRGRLRDEGRRRWWVTLVGYEWCFVTLRIEGRRTAAQWRKKWKLNQFLLFNM
jgi:hypothetical protein